MANMTHMGLAYSLRMFVTDKTGIPAYFKYDGFEYPKAKPFALVEMRTNSSYKISKLRESVQTTFRFQFGIFAESSYELASLQDKMRRLFLFSDIPLYTEDGVSTGETFMFDADIVEARMDGSDLSNVTGKHRMYFDLKVENVINRRRI